MEQTCAETSSSHQALSNEQIQSEEIGAKGGPTLPESGGQYERGETATPQQEKDVTLAHYPWREGGAVAHPAEP